MKKKSIYLVSFLTPILSIQLVYFILKLYPFSNNTNTSGDFLAQYLPIYMSLRESVRSLDFASFYWSFNKGLGGAMPSVLGFNSISPLTLLYALVPVEHFALLTLIVTLLRYGLCGLSFSYYLMRKKETVIQAHTSLLIIIFSISYALSGFIISQQYNPNFLDNLIYVPLLLLGVEKILQGNTSYKFSFILAIVLITQFYIGYMACLLIILYGLAYVIGLNLSLKLTIQRYIQLAKYSFIGAGLAAFWLLPLFNNLLESKASANEVFKIDFSLIYQPLLIFSKFFIGAIHWEEWGASHAQPQIYLGLIGIIGFIHFFISSQNHWREKLGALIFIVVMWLSFNIIFFDQIWHMGQRPVGFYFRNSWAFIVVALSYSFTSLNRHFKLSKILSLSIILFTSVIGYYLSKQNLLHLLPKQIIMTVTIMILFILLMRHINRSKKIMQLILLFLVIFELTVNAYFGLMRAPWFINQQSFINEANYYQNQTIQNLPDQSIFYRTEFYKNPINANRNYFTKTKGMTHFTSSLEYALIEVYKNLGLPSSTSMINYIPNPVTDALFNLTYYVDDTTHHGQTLQIEKYYQPLAKYDDSRMIYYNTATLPLGFVVDWSFLDLELNPTNPVMNHNQLMRTLFSEEKDYYTLRPFDEIAMNNLDIVGNYYQKVNDNLPIQLTFTAYDLDPNYLYFIRVPSTSRFEFGQSQILMNQENYYYQDRYKADQIWPISPDQNGQLTFNISSDQAQFYHLPYFELYQFDIQNFKKQIKQKQQDNLTLTVVNNHFIEANAIVNKEHQGVFFSIPYSKGWSAMIDQQKVPIEKVWNAFIGLNIAKGTHQIQLFYRPPGLLLGTIISLLSLIMIISSKLKEHKKDSLS